MKKEFRFNLESTKKHLKSLFPNENVRNNYLKAIAEYVKFAAKENNANWNVNLDNDFIRVNCGARYILRMKAENIRVMCWRETFLKLDKDFIDEFLKEVFFHKKDTKELMASDFNPQTYEELEKVPANILWHNSLQFNINPKLWAEKYAEKLMPSVLDFCKDCIKHSSIMPQMRKAHSASLIELINKEMNENLIQPEYIKELLNYENDDLERFKSLLEYFVTHMEYVVNENKDFVGYSKYIFPIQDSFKKTGIGYKGQKIQTQIANWSKYKEKEICINVHASHGSFQKRNCYLNWKGSWNNVHVEWKENNITSLYLSKEPKVDAKKELEKTIEQLGLFSENITDDLKAFFDEYMKWGIGDSQMTQEDTLVKKYANLLKNTKNLILTGAPGTGKTYLAKQIAKELGCKDDNIGFVQFHPSYDYTDFVEGLRPTDKDGNGNVGFERRDGVFKEFCAKALKNLVDSRKTEEEQKTDIYFEKVYSMFINDIKDEVCNFYQTQKGEFSVAVLENENLIFEQNNPRKKNVRKEYLKILFNVVKDNNELDIKNINRDNLDKLVSDNIKIINHVDYIQYRWALNQLVERYKQIKNTYNAEVSEKIPLKNFVFIIDEINRGEVAKIFGELFYSVDPGYRVTSDDLNAIKNGNKTVSTIKTQYANLETDGNFFDKVLQKKKKISVIFYPRKCVHHRNNERH